MERSYQYCVLQDATLHTQYQKQFADYQQMFERQRTILPTSSDTSALTKTLDVLKTVACENNEPTEKNHTGFRTIFCRKCLISARNS
ncbi:hypothetical protein J4727_18195 [Providencia rettgeri]|uniref:Uncharacterized protein n=1 Tax=Providencia rettgeri TaxID=587 RepID=A0A939NFE1_PRORE|nr:hypothetical protein [Providencia rettgeri]